MALCLVPGLYVEFERTVVSAREQRNSLDVDVMAKSSDLNGSPPLCRELPVSTGTLGVLDWGGDGSDLVLLHPNGFCAGLFDPVARLLRSSWRVLGVDLRGHGLSAAPGAGHDLAFGRLAEDVVEALDLLGIDHMNVVGQSLGGGVAVLIDRVRPGLIDRLVLAEAIAFVDVLSAGEATENFMSAAARRRRWRWPDEEAMLERFRQVPPLSELGPSFLDAYVRWGSRRDDSAEVVLRCHPDTEAAVFDISATKAGAPDAWSHLAAVTARSVVVVGDGSYLPRAWFEAQAALLRVPIVAVPGGHFMFQTDPSDVARLVNRLLDELGDVA